MKTNITFIFLSLFLSFHAMAQSSGLTDIYEIVEQMPRFPGCEHLAISDTEKEACSQQKMLEFLYSRIKYPFKARENGIEGTVIASFVVRKTGEITDVEIVRDIGQGCGAEVQRVISEMPDWVPGLQRGKPVNVRFNLPVNFKLENRNLFGKKKKKQ